MRTAENQSVGVEEVERVEVVERAFGRDREVQAYFFHRHFAQYMNDWRRQALLVAEQTR